MKDEIFTHLARTFEETGTTTSIDLDDVVMALGQKRVRAKRAIDQLREEGILIPDDEDINSYRLSLMAYSELAQALESQGRLPSPVDGKEWISKGTLHVDNSPLTPEMQVPLSTEKPTEDVIQALHSEAKKLHLEVEEFEGINKATLPIAIEALKHARKSLLSSGDDRAITQQPKTGIMIAVRKTD